MNLDPTIVLYRGSHKTGDEMCAMEAVAYMAGESWSDHPACASEVIGRFLRCWNDDLNDDGRQLLVPYVRRMVGTRAGAKIEQARSWMCADWLVRVHAPAWLDLAGLTAEAAALRELPEIVGVATLDGALPTIEAGRTKATAAGIAAKDAAAWAVSWGAWDSAWAAARAAAKDATEDAGSAAAWATWETAMEATPDAAWAASDAAWSAAWGIAWAATEAPDAAATRGTVKVPWGAAEDATWATAKAAAWAVKGSAIDPTVRVLQVSALTLLDRMIALTEVSR